jgi:hypothetical protein
LTPSASRFDESETTRFKEKLMTKPYVTAVIAISCVAALFGCQKQYEPQPRLAPASGWEPQTAKNPEDERAVGPQATPQMSPIPGPAAELRSNPEPITWSRNQAIQAVTEARCAHQSRCGRIGANRPFATWEDCMVEEHDPSRANLIECSARVSDAMLRTCMNDIRESDCDAMPDSVSRVPTCNVERLCTTGAVGVDAPRAP